LKCRIENLGRQYSCYHSGHGAAFNIESPRSMQPRRKAFPPSNARSTSSAPGLPFEVSADSLTGRGHACVPGRCKDRTIYYWTGQEFQPPRATPNRSSSWCPRQWGPPTFEIDGIMLPREGFTYEDAQRKVALIRRGQDDPGYCGGLGYSLLVAYRGRRGGCCRMRRIGVIWCGVDPWSPVAPELEPPRASASLPPPVARRPRFAVAGWRRFDARARSTSR